jgi:VWFA-related protein
MAVVVDDMGLSLEGIYSTRDALKKFVEHDVGPHDLVAVVRASGGAGILQQFTADKDVLRAAVSELRYNVSASGALTPAEAAVATGSDVRAEEMRRRLLMLGTLGALDYVVEGLRSLPGRKSIILVSSILTVRDHEAQTHVDADSVGALQRLADRANRASVVIYTVDPRGLQVLPQTQASAGSTPPASLPQLIHSGIEDHAGAQAGLQMLAHETGGRFIHNNNDTHWAVRQVIEDQRGYYLLGYVPDASTRRRGVDEYRLKVKARRPGLRVRARSKYSGSLEPEPTPIPSTAMQMVTAATSPFAVSELALRLTPILRRDGPKAHVARTFLHVDGSGLTIADADEPGMRQVHVALMTAAFGADGLVTEQVGREVTLPFRADFTERLKAAGLVLELSLPIRKPGTYQLRAVVRDVASGRQGSARYLLHVPPIRDAELGLSGISLSGVPDAAASLEVDPEASHAVRRFRPGSDVVYGFVVYAPRKRMVSPENLTTRLHLYREGLLVASEKGRTRALPVPSRSSKEQQETTLLGTFHLSGTIPPGHYLLEAVVTDGGATDRRRATATERAAFEVVAP